MAGKGDILRKNGTYNKNHDSVKAGDFQQGIFFDAEDLAQVKYEMLRSVAKGENSILEASSMYGFSRQSYYIIKNSVDKEGLSALIPKKTGPKESYKLKKEGQVFIDQYTRSHPDANSNEVNRALREATGISVHNRTVDRYMAKKYQGSRR
jgi:transposase